jgi:hypothetical protein
MVVRTSFVANSSSTSFIVCTKKFNSKEELIEILGLSEVYIKENQEVVSYLYELLINSLPEETIIENLFYVARSNAVMRIKNNNPILHKKNCNFISNLFWNTRYTTFDYRNIEEIQDIDKDVSPEDLKSRIEVLNMLEDYKREELNGLLNKLYHNGKDEDVCLFEISLSDDETFLELKTLRNIDILFKKLDNVIRYS